MTDSLLLDAVGYAAGAGTTFAFLPQVLKTLKSRSAADLSWAMLVVFNTGVALWLTYGLMLWEPPLIVANACTLALSMSVLLLKVWFQVIVPRPPPDRLAPPSGREPA